MPKKTGLEVFSEVKAYYANQRKIFENIDIVEPKFVIATAFMNKAFKTHLEKMGAKLVLE